MVTSLSDYELQLVNDPKVLLTKNLIIQKVYELFGELYDDYKNMLLAEKLLLTNYVDGKISRGENYKGLPYVVLDFPRHFAKVDVLAIRSFFWWGNFFSITLQLAGKIQQQHAGQIQKAIDENVFDGWYIGCRNEPWEHHFESDNYNLVKTGNLYGLANLPHLKLAKKIPLEKWDEANAFFKENFSLLINVLRI